jgi:hypothetical protein
MDAVYGAADGDYGLHLLSKEDERSWYNMVRHGATMTYEAWDDKFKNNQDWNHAWGAAPANVIPRWVAGVRPLEAGYSRMAIHPQFGDLNFIYAVVPTIKGSVAVGINRESDGYCVRISVPANAMAEVVLPVESQVKELCHNGRKKAINYLSEHSIDCGVVGSGEHLFQIKY